jgi:hypothetical protein
MIGFEPTTPRPPAVCANRTALHPDVEAIDFLTKYLASFLLMIRHPPSEFFVHGSKITLQE